MFHDKQLDLFRANQTCEFWAVICETYKPYSNYVFFFVICGTLIPKGAHRPWNHLVCLGGTMKLPGNCLSRTWNMVPHPRGGGKCYPRWTLQINREIENEGKPENPRFDLWFTMIFHFFTQSRIWSYGRYAHSGIRVRPKTRNKYMFPENVYLSTKTAYN